MEFKQSFRMILLVAAVMAGVQLLNSLTLGAVSSFGIVPRSLSGLIGIPLAPFIHHGWGHLISNAIPFMVLSLLVLQLGARVYWQSSVGIIVLGGLLVWLLGGSGVHAGASSLIFGYWALLLAYAWFSRSIKSLLIAMVVIILYSGMLWGFFDMRAHISWSSHTFSALAGVFMAWLLVDSSQKA